MTRILTKTFLVLFAATVPVTAQAQAALEGRWANPRHSVIVNVARFDERVQRKVPGA